MFENWVQKGNEFIKEVGEEIGFKDQKALRITKAVLHALRDRLTAFEAKDLVSQLPMILKAVWCDGWVPEKTPVKTIKTKEEFFDLVLNSPEISAAKDLVNRQDANRAVIAVFSVLKRHLSQGEVDDIGSQFPEEIKILWLQPKVFF
jgi:uncharacterized protein (DUF2267 family)